MVQGGGAVCHERGNPVIVVDMYAPCLADPHLPSIRISMGTLSIRKRTPLGPYVRPMSRVFGGSYGGGRFLMGVVPLYPSTGVGRILMWARTHWGLYPVYWSKLFRIECGPG